MTLLVVALGLWLASGPPGVAATANQNQGVSASVGSTIGWGSVTGCTQSMPAYDFGSLGAGATATSSTFTGCVSSNAKWGVTAQMTAAPTDATQGESIPGSAFVARVTTVPANPASTSCPAANTTCTLDQPRTLVAGANKQSILFSYNYNLTVPGTASGGTYTGGAVTFVAAN